LTRCLAPDTCTGVSEILDTRGMKCPLPALKAQKRLQALPAGARLTVLASDPMARIDIPHLCRSEGHTLIEAREDAGELQFDIEKAG
jgi:tRNA 2-thiouridine synthesizing protein A